jgi:outer membrane protein assembly factor BamB
MPRFLAACSFILITTASLAAADWPQFLGPNRDSSTPEMVSAWKDDLKPLWKMPVGEAHSSPVVANGRVYIFAQPKGANADALTAFDVKTGELKWKSEYDRPEYKPPFGNGPRSTPVISGDRIFTLGGTGILACWDLKTGDVAWKLDLVKEFEAKNLLFGVSTSPIMVGEDKVAVMVGGKGAGIVAFDAKTGKTAWKATDDPACYASPVLANNQLVFLTGSNLLGLSLTGEKLWAVPFKDRRMESSTTPVVLGTEVIASSVTAGTIAVDVTGSAGKFDTKKVWDSKDLSCYFSTPVVVGESVYMINGGGTLANPTLFLRCVNAKTGKVAWEKGGVGRYHAALVRCGPSGQERLLMLEDKGFLTLIEPNTTEYKELARSKVCRSTWAHPALVDHHLYLRDDEDQKAPGELICLPLPK